MINKVTSYELSKQLAEAGFDSGPSGTQSHCGWWVVGGVGFWVSDKKKELIEISHYKDPVVFYKAYDCFDLLMWLKGHCSSDFEVDINIDHKWFDVLPTGDMGENSGIDQIPQEALGQAVLKVLTQQEVQGE